MSLDAAPKHFRAKVATGNPRVDREGGMFGKGVIYDVSMITRGEALGHDLWVDREFLEDVASSVNASDRGVKARFTHPGLSSDGVGTKLGKFTNARVVGDQVIADMHLQEAAFNTPEGDLGSYVLSLAEDTPEDFGLSIVFDHDFEMAEELTAENTTKGRFVSPDEANKNNYEHARLSRLYACDVVDSPAANPAGLFKRGQEAAIEADNLLSYALGLSGSKPSCLSFGVDGDRAKQFLARFLERHNLTLVKGGDPVSDVESGAPAPTREQFAAELSRYVEHFGAEFGTEWFMAGISFEDAQGRLIVELKKQLASAKGEVEQAKAALANVKLGEKEGPEFSAPEKSSGKRSGGRIRISGKKYDN
jgi:hypothetical protein